MKEIKKEKTVTYSVYEAVDGTVFDSAEKCKDYEKTIKCVLLTKYNKLIDKQASEYEFSGAGSEEYIMDRLYPLQDEDDVDTILKLYIYYNQHKTQNDFDEVLTKLRTYLNNNDIIFIGRGYEYDDLEDCYLFGSHKEICENFLK